MTRRGRVSPVGLALGLGLLVGSAVTAQIEILHQAPLDAAVDLPLAQIEDIVSEMTEVGRTTTRLIEGGTFNVNVRRIEGVETALRHERTTDVYVVREGSATLVTGGELVDADGQPVDGARGAAIRGGRSRTIGVGDVVYIPAGVPHGITETDGITWFNIRFDTR